MSQVLWIREANDDEAECDDLWALMQFSHRLDAICVSEGIRKLSEFHDYSDAAEEFGADVEPNYSDPRELLEILSTIQKHVKDAEAELHFTKDGVDRMGDLVRDLESAIAVTQRCLEKGTQIQLLAVG